jgi:hypothetical protein
MGNPMDRAHGFCEPRRSGSLWVRCGSVAIDVGTLIGAVLQGLSGAWFLTASSMEQTGGRRGPYCGDEGRWVVVYRLGGDKQRRWTVVLAEGSPRAWREGFKVGMDTVEGWGAHGVFYRARGGEEPTVGGRG